MEEQKKEPQGIDKHLYNIFIAGAVLGALSCFARADYNLPLYAFLYIMWEQEVRFISSGSSYSNLNSFLLQIISTSFAIFKFLSIYHFIYLQLSFNIFLLSIYFFFIKLET